MTGQNELNAKVTLRVGPVKASFSGRGEFEIFGRRKPHAVRRRAGGVAGFAKGSANVRLTEESPAATLLTYEAKAEVGGKLAQLGGRLIDATARKLAGDFVKFLGRIVAPEAVETGASEPSEVENTGEAEALKPESTTEAVAAEPKTKKSWLRGLFGKSSAAALLAAGLLVPTCCLDGGHAHQFAADLFGISLPGALMAVCQLLRRIRSSVFSR